MIQDTEVHFPVLHYLALLCIDRVDNVVQMGECQIVSLYLYSRSMKQAQPMDRNINPAQSASGILLLEVFRTMHTVLIIGQCTSHMTTEQSNGT